MLSGMVVKLFVLVCLAFSLGELRAATDVPDEIAMLEAEPSDPPLDPLEVPHAIVQSVPDQVGVLPEISTTVPPLRDTAMLFRPPRRLVG